MFRLMLKTLWARRKRNGWLLAELILVALLSWAIFDPVIVVTHDRSLGLRCGPPLPRVHGRAATLGARL